MSKPSAVQNGPTPISEVPKKESLKPKPTKMLPTDRISVAKQLDFLRAYAAASNGGTRTVGADEIADIVKAASSSIESTHPFYMSVGLLLRADAGLYTPSAEAIAFLRAYEWNPEIASQKLAPAFQSSWFGQALMPKITFSAISEADAITTLAEACAAAPEYRDKLRTILEFMDACGVIQMEGGQIRKGSVAATSQTAPEAKAQQVAETPAVEVEPKPGRVMTAFKQAPEGGVQFSINVQVDMADFASWRPERISAFFGGIAQVLAAKANVEKGSSQS